jgi:hypothetical protein
MDVLELGHALLDPLDWRRAGDLLAATTQRFDLVGEGVYAPLRLHQCLRERLAATSVADEVDEVGQPSPLGGQLGFLSFRVSGRSARSLAISSSTRLSTYAMCSGSEICSWTASRMTFSTSERLTSVLLSHAPFVAARQP